MTKIKVGNKILKEYYVTVPYLHGYNISAFTPEEARKKVLDADTDGEVLCIGNEKDMTIEEIKEIKDRRKKARWSPYVANLWGRLNEKV